MQNSDIKNTTAYLIKAIENDYASQNNKKSNGKRTVRQEIKVPDEKFEADKAALLKELAERTETTLKPSKTTG